MGHKKFKFILSVIFVIGLAILGFRVFTARAITVYYFNNAVNTSPATLGNYWLDYDATEPALSLPNLAVDELNILPDSEYVGDAIIRRFGINEGTITGNATFYGDNTAQNGVVTGTKTRRYTSNITTFRDFTIFGEVWTVTADNCVVTMTSATYDGTTTFTTVGTGSFLGGVNRDSASVFHSTLLINYTTTLDTLSVPVVGDFTVTVNTVPVAVTNVAISNKKVALTLASPVSIGDTVKLTYVRGSNLIKNIYGLNAIAITNLTVAVGVPVEDASVYSTLVGNKLYVSNNHSASVTVIDTLTDNVVTTIAVQNYPEASVAVGNKLYVNNLQSASVSVINTDTDIVVATIPVGDGPYFSVVVGTKIYVSNTGVNTVSVINTNTDTVVATITVGTNPWFSGVVGTKIYVPNRSTDTVSVIDSTTDTVTSTIAVAAGSTAGTRALVIGTKVFVGRNNSVAIIDSLTNSVVATPAVGATPYFSAVLGNKLYVVNRGGSTVSVIDATTNAVTSTITVGSQPFSATVLGKRIYVNNVSSNSVSIINSLTDTVEETIAVGGSPFYSTVVGKKIYVSNNTSRSVSIIDTTATPLMYPNLVSFSSTTPNGTYTNGQSINITATFGRTLRSGSTMTVLLNTGASVTLDNVSGTTLSGTYTIDSGQTSPDLSITSITSASVTDTSLHTRTSYSLPSSQGNLVAENSFVTRNLGDSNNIIIGSFLSVFPVGLNPYQISAPVVKGDESYVYVANQGDQTVSVLRTSDNMVVDSIPVGSEPYGVVAVAISGTTYVYVANTGSADVSVINTSNNTVIATVSVGIKPYYVAAVGTKIYVTNGQSNTVSVINGATNTVTTTIPVGYYPRGIKAHGTDLYVANYGDSNYSGGNSVSVISSLTNTVTSTIVMPAGVDGPRGVTMLGSNVYVANFRSNNVSIINTATNTVTATVNVGTGPRGMAAFGTKVYIENFEDGTVSVLDTLTNTIVATVDVGHSPSGIVVNGDELYISRFEDNTVSILKTSTNTLREAAAIISGLNVISVGSTTASISWDTNKSTTATVDYGLTSDYGTEKTDSIDAYTHLISLTGLTPGTTYHYRVSVTDSDTNLTRSSDLTFYTFAGGGGGGGGGGIVPIDPEPLAPLTVTPETGTNTENMPPLDSEVKIPSPSPVITNPVNRLLSKIYLAVEDKGKLWYQNPLDNKRYPVTVATALELFRTVALGITDKNLEKIPTASSNQSPGPLSQRLKNLFLLQVENKGQTWFVDQAGYRHFVNRFNIIDMSRDVMRGMLNKELEKIETGQMK